MLGSKKPRKRVKRHTRKTGLPPGSLVYVGDQPTSGRAAAITLFDYDGDHCDEATIEKIEECARFKDSDSVTWINIDGIHEVEVLERIGHIFGLHALVLEDILNTDQRPKVEDHGHYLYVVVKMLSFGDLQHEIASEQLSLVLGPNFLLSFQDKPGDVLDPLRQRIRHARGRIRKTGTDYLLYALLDTVIDNYFLVLDKVGDRVEEIEDSVAIRPKSDTLPAIHALKRQVIMFRKAVWPMRELVTSLWHGESELIRESTRVYLRDLHDHVAQIIDGIDANRDMLSSSLDVYLSNISNRTNGIMKVLALFSAIFMPLTFITGIFGMNFKNFPELDWKYGFQATIAIMFVLGVGMLWFFWRKKWL